MLNRWRRDRKLKKVKPGDGHPHEAPGGLAALERALTIRYHWLLDGDFGEWDG